VQLDPTAHEAFDAQLSRRRYETEAPTDIFVAKAAVVREQSSRESRIRAKEVDVKQEPFADIYGTLHDNERVHAYGRMLATIGPRALAIVAYFDDAPAGMGFGVYERGWAGVFGMITLAPHRRRGVATAILHALARDADDLYLQVERDNVAARALYEGVGFTYAYGYHYRVKR
jgi:N-acetylglutamate synthase